MHPNTTSWWLRGVFVLLGVACVQVHAAAPDAGSAPGTRVARLAQGQFASSADRQALEQALARTFGDEVKIENPVVSEGQGDGAASDQVGSAVAVQGDTALVATTNDAIGDTLNQGSVYVFVRSEGVWSQQAKLVASDGAENDRFGSAVALSGDTALVGASGDDIAANVDQGSAYVFVRSGTAWSEQAKLLAPDGAVSDAFGIAVAVDGDTAVVGASSDTVGANTDQGSAYVFVRDGANWSHQGKLVADDGLAVDLFGTSVAVSGDTALVGATRDDVGANVDQGSAYVFVRSGVTWTQQTRLTAGDGAGDDRFGVAVALDGNTALVGAFFDDIAANANEGSAYVFTRSGTVWSQQDKLVASDGAGNARLGFSVALSGDSALVGAPFANGAQGAAYVFVRSGADWSEQQALTAADGAADDRFGHAVALDGDAGLVGAIFHDLPPLGNQGAAYVYVRGGTAWSEQQKLTTGDGATADEFGISVALSGDTALIGVSGDDVGTTVNQGAAYVYTRNGQAWTQQAKLVASDGASQDLFGGAVALNGDTAVVGAAAADVSATQDRGAAYVFTRNGSIWTEQVKLVSSSGTLFGGFGSAVALGNPSELVVGADGENSARGAAYVFVRSGGTWSPQGQLLASDAQVNDHFGISVAMSFDTVLVGANTDDVGAAIDQGSAYVFTRFGGAWTEQAKLLATDGAEGDRFGSAVALQGSRALVGAPQDDVGANLDQGTAYVFSRNGLLWSEDDQLLSDDGAAGDRFGASVALRDDTALIGVPAADVELDIDRGAAYVFTGDADVWSQQYKVAASDGAGGDGFGSSVAIGGIGGQQSLLVGAPRDNSPGPTASADVGSVYAFRGQSDLQISMSNGVTQVVPGQLVIYEILIANAGPFEANGASFVDTVPADITNVTWSCESVAGFAACPQDDGVGNAIAQSVNLPSGGALRYWVSGEVSPTPGAFIENTATITAPAVPSDFDPANNTATDQDTVVSIGIFDDGFEP